MSGPKGPETQWPGGEPLCSLASSVSLQQAAPGIGP